MQFRDLRLVLSATSIDRRFILTPKGETIGEATRGRDGRWVVQLMPDVSPAANGLDEDRAMFADTNHMRDWAQDTHLRSAHSALHRLSDVDLHRLRTMVDEASNARAELRRAEAYR